MEDLDQKKLDAVRIGVEATLRSDSVIDILRKKLKDIRPGLGKIPPGLFPGDLVGTSYDESILGETLISKLFPTTEVVSFSPTQIRVISAILKREILDSDKIMGMLKEAAMKALEGK
jgi:hypothetical protein